VAELQVCISHGWPMEDRGGVEEAEALVWSTGGIVHAAFIVRAKDRNVVRLARAKAEAYIAADPATRLEMRRVEELRRPGGGPYKRPTLYYERWAAWLE